MKFQAGNKDDDYDLGEDEDQPESEDNDLEQKRESLTHVFPVITLISVCTFSILFFTHFPKVLTRRICSTITEILLLRRATKKYSY